VLEYIYQYKDHLGNVRLSYSDTNNDGVITASSNPSANEIIEDSNYYPFGLQHKGYNNIVSSNGNSTAQKFGFNGKELEESLGLDLLEYGARMYDPATARFTSIDPLTEDYISQSVYAYAANNPVFFQEKNGESPETIFVGEDGEVIADIDDGSDEVFVVNKKNEEALVEELVEENVTNDNQDAETNAKIGNKHGRTLEEYKKEDMLNSKSTNGIAFNVGYENGYDPESDAPFLIQFQPGTGSAYGTGKGRGKGDKKKGIMSKVNPKIKEGKPKHNFSSMIGAARTAKGRAAEAKYNSSRHLVKKGDNLTKIAKSNNTTVGSIVKLNNIKNPDLIQPGAVIKIK